MEKISRRNFIRFLGAGSAIAVSPFSFSSQVRRVVHDPSIFPSSIDDLLVTPLLKNPC